MLLFQFHLQIFVILRVMHDSKTLNLMITFWITEVITWETMYKNIDRAIIGFPSLTVPLTDFGHFRVPCRYPQDFYWFETIMWDIRTMSAHSTTYSPGFKVKTCLNHQNTLEFFVQEACVIPSHQNIMYTTTSIISVS